MLCLAGDVLLGLAITTRAFSAAGSCGSGRFHTGPRRVLRAVHAGHAGRPRFTLRDAAAPLAALAVTAACARHKRFKLRRMHMELPALAYSLCVGLMCARGSAFGLACGGRRGALAAVGAALFLISDAVLLFVYFYVRPRKALRAVNLAAYYLGMLCLALSV
ncbi:MAG: lysoplasmalogenase family protein [Ruthenibacterium lactatiformans]